MSAVGAAPDQLDELSWGLSRQASGLDGSGVGLRRAVAATPRASAAGAPALLALEDTGRALSDLGAAFDDLSRFVSQVAGALRAADDTLAAAASASKPGGWRAVGEASGASAWRAYVRSNSRTITGTVTDPFRPGRTRTVIRRDGVAAQDGFADVPLGVAAWSASCATGIGAGAGSRWGTDAAHVDVSAFAGGLATASASTSYSGGQMQVAVRGSAMLGGLAVASAHLGNGYVSADARASAFVGARADGEAKLGAGKDGLDIEVDARVLLGGEVETEAAIDVLGVRGAAHAGVSYGLGAEAKADIEVGLGEIAFSFDLGATFGLGVSFGADLKVSPRDLGQKGAGAARRIWRKLR
jgi:hypothetical protein